MDNNVLLSQVAEVIRQQSEAIMSHVDDKIAEQTRHIEIKLETEVTQRIHALFDGYALTHEKQWELERKAEAMQAQITELQLRLTALENKSA